MLRGLIVLILVIPFLELFLLVELAALTGFWYMVGIVVLTGVVGVLTARVQGWLVWQKMQLDLQHGRLPANGLIEGMILLAAGLLLFTPGLLTDCVGFVLLVPGARRGLREWIKRKFNEKIAQGQTTIVVVERDPL